MNEINLFGEVAYHNELLILVNQMLNLLELDHQVMSISLLSKEEMHKFNKQYRQKDYPTDVISFPFLREFEEEEELGDLFICEEVVRENARKYGHSFNREYCFVIVHGILHLLGYNHQTEEEEAEMFCLQEKIIVELTKLELIK